MSPRCWGGGRQGTRACIRVHPEFWPRNGHLVWQVGYLPRPSGARAPKEHAPPSQALACMDASRAAAVLRSADALRLSTPELEEARALVAEVQAAGDGIDAALGEGSMVEGDVESIQVGAADAGREGVGWLEVFFLTRASAIPVLWFTSVHA